MQRTSSLESVSTRLLQIAELSRKRPEIALTTLAHHIDLSFLKEAYNRTRKDGAVGIDQVTAEEYEQKLDANLTSLCDRFKSGTYKAPPVRRVYIPKDGNKTRPIGIPTLEDKVLQRSVAMVMEAIYEQEFKDCSYGFRRGRSAHGALEALWRGLMKEGSCWVLEVDIQSFFDTLEHPHLRSFLDKRIRDGVLRRAIDKWLKAGVMEAGIVTQTTKGTPQGGVISPMLANIYLHEVLDRWFESVVKPRLAKNAVLIRYADDLIIIFASERDARRVQGILPKRFGKYGLTLHPEKTRLVEFKPGQKGCGRSSVFDFLGFTHFWKLSRGKKWVVTRKTSKGRLKRSLKQVKEWCRKNRHWPVRMQYRVLAKKLQGHYAYYGITGNSRAMSVLREEVIKVWRKWLLRRSQKKRLNWERFHNFLNQYSLPKAKVVHSIYHGVARPLF
ncbi:MAG TPA: group II intron reverse transcriptase/maturase [Bdellovibrionales bacterium]|nr:group II intron reverse transcriptase/maturase [Bdellovibrionales bacterium]